LNGGSFHIFLSAQVHTSIRGRDDPHLFWCERPVNRALGSGDRLGFDGRLARDHDTGSRSGPFPETALDALNDGIFDDISSSAELLILRRRLRLPFQGANCDIGQPKPAPFAHFPGCYNRSCRHTLDREELFRLPGALEISHRGIEGPHPSRNRSRRSAMGT
jgi:hypothetical protein